jgi:quaternary ammonium compound-resistance protein SugE
MYDLTCIAWLIVGGLLEPVWLLALKKSDNFKNRVYGAVAVIVMFASPLCLSFAMKGIPIGIAYAVWTGIGTVCAVCIGFMFFKEKINKAVALYTTLIICGTIGLALTGGA